MSNCKVDKAMFAFPSLPLMVLWTGASGLHGHFLGFLGTCMVAILYGIQCAINLGIFPRFVGKNMSSQQAPGTLGWRLLQPSTT